MNNELPHTLQSQFCGTWDKVVPGSVNAISKLYAKDCVFVDPFHEIHGLIALDKYLQELYNGVHSCRFQWGHSVESDDTLFVEWTMVLQHKTFHPKETLELPGCSRLLFRDGMIVHHRDFFDAGAMIYERLPVIGWILGKVRARLGASS